MRQSLTSIELCAGGGGPALGLEQAGFGSILNASSFGVPQLRQRVVIVALRSVYAEAFIWPEPGKNRPESVGKALADLMAQNGWAGAQGWAATANEIAPTIVGGSKKHGGPDLEPTWAGHRGF